MDTGDDFITAEFLHLLFFEQKNLVIFPYVDLKHLRSADVFTIGFETVDIDSTAIHNLNEIIEYECNSSYSQLQTLYFIFNPSFEELERLVDSPKLRCVINTKENVESLANGDQFVFYNKKNNTFLNYEFEGRDLSFEEEILRNSPTRQVIVDELLKIKSVSSKIFAELNQNNSSDNLPEILDEYDQKYWNKILRFTELYCQIEIPEFNRPIQLPKKKSSSKEIDYSAEYELIIKTNRKIGRSFIHLIHDYRYDRVNPANLEVTQLFYPQKLYSYLRNHHWKKGMPKEFTINWLKNTTKDFSDPEEALMEFQVMLNKLHLSYSVNNIDLERENKPEKKGSNRSELPETIPNVKQPINTKAIPSINNFSEFKKWLLNKLNELEKIV
ncbi:MAG: hypothetical protein E3J90_00010 [Promethearchaeota archaeon]|nr:MAG: hypothetical protein E3J90_00010 [Candidatus Lokiarchaeota archaeon]